MLDSIEIWIFSDFRDISVVGLRLGFKFGIVRFRVYVKIWEFVSLSGKNDSKIFGPLKLDFKAKYFKIWSS